MIQIDEVPFIPSLPFTARAFNDLTHEAWALLKKSDRIYVAREDEDALFCVGLYKATLLSTPYIWLLPCDALHWRHLRQLQVLWHELAPAALWALVRHEPSIAKFAQFFGLRSVHSVNDYFMMER